jgi:hypothetical protein
VAARGQAVARSLDAAEPELGVEAAGCRAAGEPGRWRMTWRMQNLSGETIELLEVWAPHGQFRAEAQPLDPSRSIAPGESTSIELSVASAEPPGAIVENAFVILRLRWRHALWRALVRHRVVFDSGGVPQPICDNVTVQPVGFANRERQTPRAPEDSNVAD